MKHLKIATLFIVATPIGNLEDITLRALRILKEVDVIACEDTRVTQKLLHHYNITSHLISYHAHSGFAKVDKMIEMLLEGKKVALVSDAGTPAISDPGSVLVRSIREWNEEHTHTGKQISIEVIPGPSALISAISLSGIKRTQFMFLGFPPHKKGRQTFFKKIGFSHVDDVFVFYESSHRIIKALESLVEFAPSKKVSIMRELTKMFEDVQEGDPKSLLDYYNLHEEEVRGEFVVIVW
jgi:16S rRNA (cytidine1402-2'-O)-methyltransferase